MNVFYNFEVDDEVELKITTPEILTFLNELRAFIKIRLKVLEDEINTEEKLSYAYTLMMLPNPDKMPEGIRFMGYSDELTIKMNSCISPDDIDYLHRRFSDGFN